jgi:hypothetical protein
MAPRSLTWPQLTFISGWSPTPAAAHVPHVPHVPQIPQIPQILLAQPLLCERTQKQQIYYQQQQQQQRHCQQQ